jgi:hypothetical protein
MYICYFHDKNRPTKIRILFIIISATKMGYNLVNHTVHFFLARRSFFFLKLLTFQHVLTLPLLISNVSNVSLYKLQLLSIHISAKIAEVSLELECPLRWGFFFFFFFLIFFGFPIGILMVCG